MNESPSPEADPAEHDPPAHDPASAPSEPIPRLGAPVPKVEGGPNAVRFTIRFLLLVMLACAAYAFWIGAGQRRTKEQLQLVEPLKEYGAEISVWEGEVTRISLKFSDDKGKFDPQVLEPLTKLPKLKRLVLMDTNASEAMITQLGKISTLEELLIVKADLAGADLSPLANLKDLRVLWLWDCKLNDSTLDPFETMQSLRMLNLNDNKLTDNGLLRLAPLVDLEQVHMANNEITDNGVNLVKQTLLNARIIREPIPGYQP